MNGPPRKQVLEQLDALKREIAKYHRSLAEFPAVCRVLENLMLRIEVPLPGAEQTRYRNLSNLRDELRAMRAGGVPAVDPLLTPNLFTDDEVDDFYDKWNFNEEDPGRIEFSSLFREIEFRVRQRIALGVPANQQGRPK